MENIRIAVLSTDENVCAFFDNSIPDAMHYEEACLHTYLQGSAYTLDVEATTTHEDTQHLIEGNKISFMYKGKDYMCNIVSVERTETNISISCWGLLLELTNETREAYKSNGAMSLVQYLNYIDPEHVLTLGINEVSDKSIANEWEGSQTILARLYSIANVFGAEFEFITELNDNYTLKQITLNVYRAHDEKYQGMGAKRTDQNLRFGTEIETIRKKASITDLYTAIRVIGKDGVTISGLDRKEYDADGNLEYFTGADMIYAPIARDRFPSSTNKSGDGYIVLDWNYDSDNKEVLYGQGLAQLKKYCVPQVTYEISGYYDANIGDTFTIVDYGYKPTLILEARVTEQKEFFVDPSKNETTYSNVIEMQSEVDPNLLAAMQKLIEDKKLYTRNITTDNGTIFKNGIGSTTLTAQVKDGAIDVTDNYTIRWYKDGNALTAAKSVTVRAEDVTDKATYKFLAYDNNEITIGQYEATVTNIDDGVDGKKGEKGDTGNPGKDGTPGENAIVGELSLSPIILPANASGAVTNYAGAIGAFKVFDGTTEVTSGVTYSLVSATGVTASIDSTTGAYTVSSMPNTTDYGTAMLQAVYKGITIQKVLSVIKAKQGASGAPGADGADGENGLIISETPPSSPCIGQLWQTASGELINRWNGSQWVIWYMNVTNLNVENLAAITATMGNLKNPYSATYEGEQLKGEIVIGNSVIQNDYTVSSSGQKGHWELNPLSYLMTLKDSAGKMVAGIELSAGNLMLYTNEYNKWLSLSAEMLYDTGWVEQTLLNGATGHIYVRRYMKRKMIWFKNLKLNQAFKNVAKLSGEFLASNDGMYVVPVWNTASTMEKFQINADGSVAKITNNSATDELTGFIEYY